MNKTIIIGRISNELELRTTSSGKSVVNFNVAVGRFNDEVDFIPIQLWGTQAENLVQYQGKGNQIAIEGSIRVDNYTDADGNNRRSVYVLAQNVKFLDKKTISTNNEENEEVADKEEDPFAEFGESVEIEDNFLD